MYIKKEVHAVDYMQYPADQLNMSLLFCLICVEG